MKSSFLEIARQGRNGWQQYLIGILLLLIMPILGIGVIAVIVTILIGLFLSFSSSSGRSLTQKEALGKVFSATFYGFPFFKFFILGIFVILFILTLVFVIEQIHERKFSTLLGFQDGSWDWKRTIQGFGVSFSLSTGVLLVLYLINPSRYQFSFKAAEWFLSLPFSFLVSVFVSTCGCIFFFSYLLQGLGTLIRKSFRLTIVYSLIFAALSIAFQPNPTPIDWLRVFLITMFNAWLVLKDDGLELLLGLLIARYFFTLVVSRIPSKELPIPSILIVTSELNSLISLLIWLGVSALFYYICFYIKPKKTVG